MYKRPGWLVRNLANPALNFVVNRLGLGIRGAHVLAVRGRSSGDWRTVPVYPLDHGGARYLVAPRGETAWVRNLRASGEGELRRGARTERFRAEELADIDKPPIIHAYLERWQMETKNLFGVGADATPKELTRIAPNHPVFRLLPASETAPPLKAGHRCRANTAAGPSPVRSGVYSPKFTPRRQSLIRASSRTDYSGLGMSEHMSSS